MNVFQADPGIGKMEKFSPQRNSLPRVFDDALRKMFDNHTTFWRTQQLTKCVNFTYIYFGFTANYRVFLHFVKALFPLNFQSFLNFEHTKYCTFVKLEQIFSAIAESAKNPQYSTLIFVSCTRIRRRSKARRKQAQNGDFRLDSSQQVKVLLLVRRLRLLEFFERVGHDRVRVANLIVSFAAGTG